jgi:hypothetical protein
MTHNRFSPFVLLLLALCLLPQCRGKNVSSSEPSGLEISGSYERLAEDIQTIMNNRGLSADELVEAMSPYLDSIVAMANDSESLGNRMASQILAHQIINLMTENYLLDDESDDSIMTAFDKVVMPSVLEALEKWFIDISNEAHILWSDKLYISAKDADEPINGYFHIMVLMQVEDDDVPELDIFFPDCAESLPVLAFAKDANFDSLPDNRDEIAVIPLDQWFAKNELEEGYPLFAMADQQVVEMMLEYDIMFISFNRSKDEEDTNMYEKARLTLAPFQEKYQEYMSNYSE